MFPDLMRLAKCKSGVLERFDIDRCKRTYTAHQNESQIGFTISIYQQETQS